jgi:hypothetical protein
MKRILAVLSLAVAILLGAVGVTLIPHRTVHAQNTPYNLTMGTTVNANIYGGQNYFYLLISGGNVTTFNIINQTAGGTTVPSYPGVVTVVFQQDGTGSRTVGWGTMFATATIPTVTATANKYCVMQFYYDTQSGLWFPLSTAAIHN